jgi:hypothetical protein
VELRLSLQRQRFAGGDLPRQFAIAGGQPDVNTQVTQPTDDMLSDLVYGLERDLEHACEEAKP